MVGRVLLAKQYPFLVSWNRGLMGFWIGGTMESVEHGAWNGEGRSSAHCELRIDRKQESEIRGARAASAPGPQGHGQNRSRQREEAERSAIPARNPPPHVGGYGVR